jgi:hypothetical protein
MLCPIKVINCKFIYEIKIFNIEFIVKKNIKLQV